jgi:hypothetical protein
MSSSSLRLLTNVAEQYDSPKMERKRRGSESGNFSLDQLADECFHATTKKAHSSVTAIEAPVVVLESNEQPFKVKFADGVMTIFKKIAADENKSLSFEGQIEFNDGTLYRGMIQDGKINGYGKMIYKSGDTYEGHFLNNKKSGHGSYSFQKGGFYNGEFAEGTYNGKGTLVDAAGNRYEGDFASGNYNGDGIRTLASGSIYTGKFKDGKYHGFGTLVEANGDKYEGEWENGLPHGFGTETNAISVYEGQYEKGNPNGEGSFLFKNGVHYIGQIKNGVYHGKGTLCMPNGWMHKGNFVNGNLDGEVVCQYKNQRYFRQYQNGMLLLQ